MPMKNGVSNVGKETLRNKIKHYIQEQITKGVYKPGDRLVETQLARQLNVSQSPVREAILDLTFMGILEERPYSGTFVSSMSARDIMDVFHTRAYLEECAARRAAQMATDEDIAELDEIVSRMETCDDSEAFTALDKEFHGKVMQIVHSPALERAWWVLRMAEWTYLSVMITNSSPAELTQQHRQLLDFIRARDDHSAAAYMYLHVKGFGTAVSRYFDEIEKKQAEQAAQNAEPAGEQ